MKVLGIDIGGSAIKYSLIDISETKTEILDRSIDDITFSNTPEEYCRALERLITDNTVEMTVGIAFPTVIHHGKMQSVSSPHSRFFTVWPYIYERFCVQDNYRIFCLNDADAAGIAELAGPHKNIMNKGVAILLTLGTGIGSAIFIDGHLLPNSELAYLRMHGCWAEQYMAASVINKENLTMDEWAERLNEYLIDLERILNPDTVILGGKISNDFDQYKNKLSDIQATIMPAFYRNDAGIIGAAQFAFNSIKNLETK